MTRIDPWIARAAVLLALSLSGCGFGDAFVTGFANGGNRIYASEVLDQIAAVLAESSAVPAVTDEMLVAGFDAIRRRAGEGDPETVLILYQVAERQREKRE